MSAQISAAATDQTLSYGELLSWQVTIKPVNTKYTSQYRLQRPKGHHLLYLAWGLSIGTGLDTTLVTNTSFSAACT